MYYENAIKAINDYFNRMFKPTDDYTIAELRGLSYAQDTCFQLIDIISDHPFDDAMEWVTSFVLTLEYYKSLNPGPKGVDVIEIELETAYAILDIFERSC